MASYRPLTDVWILARAKLKGGVKRYGSYLGGFPDRARILIGCPLDTPMLHVCGGHARLYPYVRGFGPQDRTMDLDAACEPDFLMDVREKTWPKMHRSIPKNRSVTVRKIESRPVAMCTSGTEWIESGLEWGGILIDPPYSEPDAEKYLPGRSKYPNPNQLVQTAINHLRIGYKVGIIHYVWPACPKNAMEIAHVAVTCGRNNRERAFVVYERTK